VSNKKIIDFSVFIDTPLDIALARRVTRDFRDSPTENILSDLDNYISRGRRGYLNMLKHIEMALGIQAIFLLFVARY
jgi:uridine kinase